MTYFIGLDIWLFLTVLFANFATALAEARGKAQADSLRRARQETMALSPEQGGSNRGGFIGGPEAGRHRRRGGGPDDPRRRGDHRRGRRRQRIGDYRRIGPGHPRGRRRPFRGDRRDHGHLRPDRGGDHQRPGRFLPRPDDRPGRRGHPPAHPERDRPHAGALGLYPGLPDRRDAALADGLERRTVHDGLSGLSRNH